MEIVSLGHSSFKIIGKEVTLVCDPYGDSVGLKFPRVEAGVVTVSHGHDDHCATNLVRGDFICFDSPGEYEIKNIEIVGIETFHDKSQGSERGLNTIFKIKMDGITLCHLGDLGQDLASAQLEKIDNVDILFVPVGGKYTIGPEEAVKVIAEIGPKIVIPMHYKAGKMSDLEPLDSFLKEIGKEAKKVDKLKIQKRDVPEEMELYVLKN